MNPLLEMCLVVVVQAHANTDGVAQEWVRLMLSCVGRGGNAQQVLRCTLFCNTFSDELLSGAICRDVEALRIADDYDKSSTCHEV